MARSFAQIHKAETQPAPVLTPGIYNYGPPGARRARTYSQVIAEATRGIEAGAVIPPNKPTPNGPPVEDRQQPDWRGHYLGKHAVPVSKHDFLAIMGKNNPNHVPAGSSDGGQFASDGGGGGGGDGGIVGYHGASTKILSSVRSSGLKPGGDKRVWLANNQNTAALFGSFKGGKAIVFEVHVPKEEMAHFDALKANRGTQTGSLDRAIPAKWIKGYHEVTTVPQTGKPGKVKDVLGPLLPLKKSADDDEFNSIYVLVPVSEKEMSKVEAPGTLYVHRPLTNAADLHLWAKGAGIPNLVPPEEMHVTQVYSRQPVSGLNVMGNTVTVDGGARSLEPLGDQGAVVLHFASQELQDRHDEAMAAGASLDFPKYLTHVTLSYDAGAVDLDSIDPPSFPLVFGPEIHRPINEDWTEEKGLRKVIKAEVVNAELGLVLGWAIICKEDGEPYYDLNIDWEGEHAGKRVPEHIPEGTMLKGALDFALTPDRPGNEMHAGPETGSFPFVWPLTDEIAKAMGITCKRTGLMVGYYPEASVLAKFKSGEYTGFSIEGFRGDCTEHD